MKNKILFLIILQISTCIGQVKKKPLPKSNPILGVNLEDASMYIDNSFYKNGYTITNASDTKNYEFDEFKNKTDEIGSYEREFTFNGYKLTLIASSSKNVKEIVLINNESKNNIDAEVEKFLKIFQIGNWPVLELKPNYKILENDKYKAHIQKNKNYLSINVFKHQKRSNGFNDTKIDSITHETHIILFSDYFAKKLSDVGKFKLLYTKQQRKLADEDGNFLYSYTQCFFSQGILMDIIEKKSGKKQVYIYNSNAVIFNAIRNLLIDNTWKYRCKFKKNGSTETFYKYNNIIGSIDENNKCILFELLPSEDFFTLRQNFASELTISEMDNIYYGFETVEERENYLIDHFAKSGNYYYFLKDNISLNVYFGNENEKKTNSGFKYLIDSSNGSVINDFIQNMDTAYNKFEVFKVSNNNYIASNQYPLDTKQSRIQFYDLQIYQANEMKNKINNDMQALNLQKLQQQKEQQAILEAQKQAEKNKKMEQNMKAINGMFDQILQSTKK